MARRHVNTKAKSKKHRLQARRAQPKRRRTSVSTAEVPIAGMGHNNPPIDLADESLDVLRGAECISKFIGVDVRRFYYLVGIDGLPFLTKEGSMYVTTKTAARRYYNGGAR